MPYFKLIITAALLTIIGAGIAIFQSSKEGSLTIEHAYQKALQCNDNKDFNCALDNINAILSVDSSHEAAKQLLEITKTQRATFTEEQARINIQSCVSNMDLICAQETLVTLKKAVPTSSLIPNFEKKIKRIQDQIELSRLIPEAYNCLNVAPLTDSAIRCAQENLASAQALSPEDPAVVELQKKLSRAEQGYSN
ncbi:MAG TPA: hypothetical protein VIC26_07105 [Marinagarivorans sp.]